MVNINTLKGAKILNNKISKGDWFVLYHAPWCGWCKQMMPEWKILEKKMKNRKDINIISIENSQIENIDIAKGNIYGFPTINYYKNGIVEKYNLGRTSTDFEKFIKLKKGGGKKTKSNKKKKKRKTTSRLSRHNYRKT